MVDIKVCPRRSVGDVNNYILLNNGDRVICGAYTRGRKVFRVCLMEVSDSDKFSYYEEFNDSSECGSWWDESPSDSMEMPNVIWDNNPPDIMYEVPTEYSDDVMTLLWYWLTRISKNTELNRDQALTFEEMASQTVPSYIRDLRENNHRVVHNIAPYKVRLPFHAREFEMPMHPIFKGYSPMLHRWVAGNLIQRFDRSTLLTEISTLEDWVSYASPSYILEEIPGECCDLVADRRMIQVETSSVSESSNFCDMNGILLFSGDVVRWGISPNYQEGRGLAVVHRHHKGLPEEANRTVSEWIVRRGSAYPEPPLSRFIRDNEVRYEGHVYTRALEGILTPSLEED
jgi:hypothetical protein